MGDNGARRLGGPDFARSGSADPGSDPGSGDPRGAIPDLPSSSKRNRPHRVGLGVGIAVALGIVFLAALGDVGLMVLGVGGGIAAAVGVGFLIGIVLCETLSRRNRS